MKPYWIKKYLLTQNPQKNNLKRKMKKLKS